MLQDLLVVLHKAVTDFDTMDFAIADAVKKGQRQTSMSPLWKGKAFF
jgi:hypothetical protein